MMAPVRRITQLLGSAVFALVYGFIHTAVDPGRAGHVLRHRPVERELASAAVFMLIGSLSFVGIGMMAAMLPLL